MIRREHIEAWVCSCERCDEWRGVVIPLPAEPPKRCPRCTSPYWRTKRGVLKRGRPRKERTI